MGDIDYVRRNRLEFALCRYWQYARPKRQVVSFVNLCIIPARGGSKRIPRKNVKKFFGKPAIAWSIEAAIESECFGKVIVSTDDSEIKDISEGLGACVPFLRPESLADDHTGTIAVVRHAITAMCDLGFNMEYVCCVYPVAPLIRTQDIVTAFNKIQGSPWDFVFPVTKYPFPIQRAVKLSVEGQVAMFQPGLFDRRSQDLEEAYHDVGQFYWGKADAWMTKDKIFGPTSAALILPRHRVQDIDDFDDWRRAELLFELIRSNRENDTPDTSGE